MASIWGRKCDRCERVLVPPRMYCEQCYRPTDRWVKLARHRKGRHLFDSYVNFDASRRKEPILVAVVEIDGASPLMGILHLLGEVTPEKIKIGMRVQAVWKESRERTGAITDISYFKPMGGKR